MTLFTIKQRALAMLEKNAFPAAMCLTALLCLAACSPFSHLTEVNNTLNEAHGPKAADCGQCHIEQFGEWQTSAHAQAFTNSNFQAALADGADESCLGCHVPDTVRTNGESPSPRRYNRQDGVSCAACHLDKGAMTGPEQKSALFSPHPVTVQPDFFRNSDICGTCHTETFADWQTSRTTRPTTPTCQECHMPQVVRTATKGSNPFSKALVAFEDSHPTRRHTFGLSHLAGLPDAVRMELLRWQPAPLNALQLSITNALPHSLPTGAFRSRPAHLTVRLYSQNHVLIAENQATLVGENLPPLKPGEQRQILIRLATTTDAQAATASLCALELRLDPSENQAGLTLAAREIPLPGAP